MSTIVIAVVCGFLITMLVLAIIAAISTLEDLTWKDWLTLWPYEHWISEFESMFDWLLVIASTLLFALALLIELVAAESTADRTADAPEGCCTCRCKKCQETALKADAAVQYLGLGKEDIFNRTEEN